MAAKTTSKIWTKCKLMPAWVCGHPPQWAKASQLSKKEGKQITCVFLTSLLCTLSPTATSCLPAFLTDFCPKFSYFPSSVHSCPDNLPCSHLLSFGNKCGLSSSCSKQSFQSFYYSFFLENFISFSSLFSFFYFLNNSKNICPESGTDHTMCIVFYVSAN